MTEQCGHGYEEPCACWYQGYDAGKSKAEAIAQSAVNNFVDGLPLDLRVDLREYLRDRGLGTPE